VETGLLVFVTLFLAWAELQVLTNLEFWLRQRKLPDPRIAQFQLGPGQIGFLVAEALTLAVAIAALWLRHWVLAIAAGGWPIALLLLAVVTGRARVFTQVAGKPPKA
jgi:hypothetical protein